jgi:hypothetical protein
MVLSVLLSVSFIQLSFFHICFNGWLELKHDHEWEGRWAKIVIVEYEHWVAIKFCGSSIE